MATLERRQSSGRSLIFCEKIEITWNDLWSLSGKITLIDLKKWSWSKRSFKMISSKWSDLSPNLEDQDHGKWHLVTFQCNFPTIALHFYSTAQIRIFYAVSMHFFVCIFKFLFRPFFECWSVVATKNNIVIAKCRPSTSHPLTKGDVLWGQYPC